MTGLPRFFRKLGVIVVLAIASGNCPALAASAADTTVQTAASLARFAGAFCGISQQSISAYKRAVKNALPPSVNFESDWQFGWGSSLNRIVGYRDLRATDPKDFAARVREDCSLVRWEAPKQAGEFCATPDNAQKSALCH